MMFLDLLGKAKIKEVLNSTQTTYDPVFTANNSNPPSPFLKKEGAIQTAKCNKTAYAFPVRFDFPFLYMTTVTNPQSSL